MNGSSGQNRKGKMKKKLLIVSSSLDTGGAQKMISNITMALPKEWRADILINSDQNIQFPYRGKLLSLNVNEPKSRMSLVYQARVLIRRLRMLKRLKKSNRYCACISLLDSPNLANILSGSKHCKTIITAVCNLSHEKKIKKIRFLVFPMVRLLYNHASHIVVQNQDIMDDLTRHFGIRKDKCHIIYNGIDTASVLQKSRELLDDKDGAWFSRERTIISAGRLSWQKGQWHLIRAFHQVRQKIPDAKLVIYGEGELKDYLNQLIKDYDMADAAVLKPFDTELDKYIGNSAVFAFPSMMEGMPTVLLEALASGTMVAVTDFESGAREILDYADTERLTKTAWTKYGVITPLCSGEMRSALEPLEKQEKLLAEALTTCLLDPGIREKYSRAGLERSRCFDMETIIHEWIRVVEQEEV